MQPWKVPQMHGPPSGTSSALDGQVPQYKQPSAGNTQQRQWRYHVAADTKNILPLARLISLSAFSHVSHHCQPGLWDSTSQERRPVIPPRDNPRVLVTCRGCANGFCLDLLEVSTSIRGQESQGAHEVDVEDHSFISPLRHHLCLLGPHQAHMQYVSTAHSASHNPHRRPQPLTSVCRQLTSFSRDAKPEARSSYSFYTIYS